MEAKRKRQGQSIQTSFSDKKSSGGGVKRNALYNKHFHPFPNDFPKCKVCLPAFSGAI